MKFTRETLQANQEYTMAHDSQYVTVLNMGPGNLFINVNDTATFDSLYVPPYSSRTLYFDSRVKYVHVIADDEALIQVDGLG